MGHMRLKAEFPLVDVGAEFQTITAAMAAGLRLPMENGAVVAVVRPEGPADKAGLKYKDIVLSLGGAAAESSRQSEEVDDSGGGEARQHGPFGGEGEH